MAKKTIYLDYAAATPMDKSVLTAMQPFFMDRFYNPSATYKAALDVNKTMSAARSKVAHWLGARSSEIIFTAGGTEANNLAIHGIMKLYPNANILVSAIEHESVILPAQNYNYRVIKVQADGRLDLEDLETKIDDQTVLISIMQANNEIGTVQPIREVSRIIAKIRQRRISVDNNLPLYLHSDACQAANYLDIHVARLGVDLLSLNGGKIYGPKQSGALYVKGGVLLAPLIDGGGQERGWRSGTENVAGLVGFAEALDLAQTMHHQESFRLQNLQKKFFELIDEMVPSAKINGSKRFRLPNNVHLTIPGQDNERLLILLDQAGIMAAAGSACSASHETPSHVLKALGLNDEAAQSSLRFTMGRGTDVEQLPIVTKTLAKLLN
ncbi:MAG TPA: cysteine desulfurase family protein [Candidatus Saccharimonadales bacterium]|nr:cysteine desulfurase family protein [Candidatus Saccharimonadales bacterium]